MPFWNKASTEEKNALLAKNTLPTKDETEEAVLIALSKLIDRRPDIKSKLNIFNHIGGPISLAAGFSLAYTLTTYLVNDWSVDNFEDQAKLAGTISAAANAGFIGGLTVFNFIRSTIQKDLLSTTTDTELNETLKHIPCKKFDAKTLRAAIESHAAYKYVALKFIYGYITGTACFTSLNLVEPIIGSNLNPILAKIASVAAAPLIGVQPFHFVSWAASRLNRNLKILAWNGNFTFSSSLLAAYGAQALSAWPFAALIFGSGMATALEVKSYFFGNHASNNNSTSPINDIESQQAEATPTTPSLG